VKNRIELQLARRNFSTVQNLGKGGAIAPATTPLTICLVSNSTYFFPISDHMMLKTLICK